MVVLLIGEGPAIESAEAMLADSEVAVTRGSIPDLPGADMAIVVGLAGSDGFDRVNELAAESDTPWIAVELGGIGGHPVEALSATISTFRPGIVCYDCLRSRVTAAGIRSTGEPTAERPMAHLAGSYAGLQAIRAFSGERVVGTILELPYEKRRLLPVPGCEQARVRDRALELDEGDRTLEESISRAEVAVDGRTGIITQVGEHESFPLPYYLGTLTDTTEWSDGTAPDGAAGVGPTWDEAFMKSLGEGLERYSGAIYRLADLERVPPDAIQNPGLDQYVSVTGDVKTEIESDVPVVDGIDLRTEEPVTLPADLVFFPQPEGRLGQSITTGLGVGNGGVDAVLSGLYETIERDATMLSWYSTFEPLGLGVSNSTFATMVERARGNGLSVTPLLVTQDIDVPVVTVAVTRETYPRLAMGSAANLDTETAAIEALSEALQNWIELRDLGPEQAADAGGEIGSYARDPGLVAPFLDPTDEVPAGAVGPDTVPDGREELDFVLEKAADLQVYATSVTPRDVEQVGFTAVRVLSPSAQPLFISEPVFGERARTVPADLGFEPRLEKAFHPYP